MRVIGGKYKGRALFTLADNQVRPTTDRVKESIFDLIRGQFEGKNVLDLFAGSGALGIECLSRGAASAVFIDKSKEAANVIRQNLDKIGATGEVYNSDYKTALSKLSSASRRFGLILLDPPYHKNIESEILTQIALKDILEADGLIVLERQRDNDSYIIPHELALYDSRDYGSTSIDILKKLTKAAVTGTFDPFTNGHRYLVEQALRQFDLVHIVFLDNPEKTTAFDLSKRIKFARLSTRDLGKRVKIDYFSGYAIDYCKRYGINHIVRGYRNPQDLQYETLMADYNLTHGGVQTLILQAKDDGISSTLVKSEVLNQKDISALVSPDIANEITKEGKKWKT